MSKVEEWWFDGLEIAESQELPLDHAFYFAWVYVQERIEEILEAQCPEFGLNADEESV